MSAAEHRAPRVDHALDRRAGGTRTADPSERRHPVEPSSATRRVRSTVSSSSIATPVRGGVDQGEIAACRPRRRIQSAPRNVDREQRLARETTASSCARPAAVARRCTSRSARHRCARARSRSAAGSRACCAVAAGVAQRDRREHGRARGTAPGATAAPELLGHERRVEQPEAAPAVRPRGSGRPQRRAPRVAARTRRGRGSVPRSSEISRTRVDGRVLREQAPEGLLQEPLFVGKSEVHRVSPLRRRGLRLARHAEAALRDDVLLDLRRAAADDQPEREHVLELPEAVRALVLRAVGTSTPSSPITSSASAAIWWISSQPWSFDDQSRDARATRRAARRSAAASSGTSAPARAPASSQQAIAQDRARRSRARRCASSVSISSTSACSARLELAGVAEHVALVLQRGVARSSSPRRAGRRRWPSARARR